MINTMEMPVMFHEDLNQPDVGLETNEEMLYVEIFTYCIYLLLPKLMALFLKKLVLVPIFVACQPLSSAYYRYHADT